MKRRCLKLLLSAVAAGGIVWPGAEWLTAETRSPARIAQPAWRQVPLQRAASSYKPPQQSLTPAPSSRASLDNFVPPAPAEPDEIEEPRLTAVQSGDESFVVQASFQEPMTTLQPSDPIATQSSSPAVEANPSAISSLLRQLPRGEERAAQSAAPAASGVDLASQNSASAVDATQLVKQSNSNTSISGIRRSPIAIQPVVRGYSQSQIYSQYQGGNFVPVRSDFDSILSSLDPGVIDNLVIIPGPYGVRYGPGLSFIDVVATPTPRYEVPEFHARSNVLYQSNGAQLYGRQAFFGGGADYGFRVSVGQKVGSDYYSGDGTQIPASYNVRDLDLAVGFDLNEFTKLELEYLTQDITNTEFAGLIFDADFRKTDALFARLTIDEPDSTKWLVEAWFNRTTMKGDNLNTSKQAFYRNNVYFNSSVPAQPFPHVSFTGFTEAQTENVGFRLAPSWGETGDTQITAGIDFRYIAQRLDEFDLFEDKTLQNSPTGYDNFPVPPAKSYDPGLFLEVKVPLEENFSITTGARLDFVVSDADPFHRARAPDGTYPPIIDGLGVIQPSYEVILGDKFDQRQTLIAAFIAADYKIDETLEFRAGFGHGERAANATERYAYFPFLTVIQQSSNFVLGTPGLKQEKANQFDLSLAGTYDDVRFHLSGFASYVEDYITVRMAPAGSGPLAQRFLNTNATLAGAEASTEVDLHEQWTAFANASYVSGRDLEIDEPLPSIFPFQSRSGIRWHDPTGKRYGVEFAIRAVTGQNQVAASLLEPTTPGFTTYDLRGFWHVNEHLKLSGGVENITNKNYLEHLNVHVPPVLEPGTNLFVGVQWDY